MSGKIVKYKKKIEKPEEKTASRVNNEVTAQAELSPSEKEREEALKIIEYAGQAGKAAPKASKKRIVLTVLLCCIGFIVLYYGIEGAGKLIKNIRDNRNNGQQGSKIVFFPADYDEDITKDAGYIDLDRNFYFEDPSYGTKYAYNTETLDEVSESYRASVRVLTTFLESAIKGDTDKINSCFSEYYIKADGKLKTKVAPQKLYDIVITLDADVSGSFPDSDESYCFWVEYKIRMNNGTFRDDMGSNCIRKEYVMVSVREGKGEIDSLNPFTIAN